MSTALHGAQVVGGMQKPHDKGERAVGVYGLDHNGDRGGVRGLKDRISRHLRAFRGDKVRSLA